MISPINRIFKKSSGKTHREGEWQQGSGMDTPSPYLTIPPASYFPLFSVIDCPGLANHVDLDLSGVGHVILYLAGNIPGNDIGLIIRDFIT